MNDKKRMIAFLLSFPYTCIVVGDHLIQKNGESVKPV